METRNKLARKWLIIAIVLMLVSSIGASMVQSQGGKVTIKDMRWETSAGRQLSALLFKPDTATADNPAPAIVVSHGWYNHREMQDLNYVEYSRRGYVVISIDMYGHGHSDVYPAGNGWEEHGTGMYDAVLLLADLPYVDSSRIGITGHSNGARAANLTIDADNAADTQLVSTVLLVANDATYKNPETEEYWNKYGSRDVGIIAARYDEFFFRRPFADGTTSVPRTYMGTLDAQSFLNFGKDPTAETLETRSAETYYKENIDGKDTIRVIHQPNQTHPWNHFSKTCSTMGINFFESTLGAPNPISATNQVWQWKVLFNTIGLIGIALFLVNLTIVMLHMPSFSSLLSKEEAVPAEMPTGTGRMWFWGGLLVSALVAALSFFYILDWANANRPQSIFWQVAPLGVGLWAALCGLVSIIIMVLFYKLYGKKNGIDLTASGVKISLGKLGKTVLLALIVVFVTYSTVFLSEYFFQTDFRIWVITIHTFDPSALLVLIPYLPLFLLYYIANSVSVNCFNYVSMGKKEWVNTAVLAVFNALGPAVMVIIQYLYFLSKGAPLFARPAHPMGPLGGIWLLPVLIFLPAAAVCSRKLYRMTKNPYLAGIINGILVTVISCTSTLTVLPVLPS